MYLQESVDISKKEKMQTALNNRHECNRKTLYISGVTTSVNTIKMTSTLMCIGGYIRGKATGIGTLLYLPVQYKYNNDGQ